VVEHGETVVAERQKGDRAAAAAAEAEAARLAELNRIASAQPQMDDASEVGDSDAGDANGRGGDVDDDGEYLDEDGPAQDNVFGITLFCIDEQFEARAAELLAPAFSLFPDREYCVLTLPHT
jgi:hypothetical protein